MKFQGTIKVITGVKQLSPKFSKSEMVVVTDTDKYPQTFSTEWVNDSANIPSNYAVGDVVEVLCEVRGREWTSPTGDVKYFTSLRGLTLAIISKANKPEPTASDGKEDTSEDLPF